jgi:hypothetical protein
MQRRRVSIRTENRIWDLRSQGYPSEHIGAIVNVSPATISRTIRRVARRPPLELDPIRRGRGHSFLDDDQVSDIRSRWRNGESQFSIGKRYSLSQTSISLICSGKSYSASENQAVVLSFPFSFGNRLMVS